MREYYSSAFVLYVSCSTSHGLKFAIRPRWGSHGSKHSPPSPAHQPDAGPMTPGAIELALASGTHTLCVSGSAQQSPANLQYSQSEICIKL